MSMILEALTRAEHERQIEKQPDLKFVTPVKQPLKRPNSAWPWIVLLLITNIIVLAIFLWPEEDLSEISETSQAPVSQKEISSLPTVDTHVAASTYSDELEQTQVSTNLLVELDSKNNNLELENDRPLAMELNNTTTNEQLDRPLIYEAKQVKQATQTKKSPSKAAAENTSTVTFSQTELSIEEDEQTIAQAPKLLIDQGQDVETPSQAPKLKDLPLSSRNNLNQYEVNVHVFDDNPSRRFVLINMDKYKEGEHIANNGPLVEEITREGVIVDYGNGRALLPPK